MNVLAQHKGEIGRIPIDLIACAREDVGPDAEHTYAGMDVIFDSRLFASTRTRQDIYDLLVGEHSAGQTTLDQVTIPKDTQKREAVCDVITAICSQTAAAFLRRHEQNDSLISSLAEAAAAEREELDMYVTVQIMDLFFPEFFR